MAVSREELRHIANLARLNLTDEELDKYNKDLDEILDFANMINSVDTSNISETVGTNHQKNVFRKDEVVEPVNRDLLLQNAPSQDEGMFRIPKVINS